MRESVDFTVTSSKTVIFLAHTACMYKMNTNNTDTGNSENAL